MVAAHVYYTGRVQGVGFRFTCQEISRRFQIGGFVRNLPDGRVELLAEGAAGEVRGFLRAVDEALRANIHGKQADESALSRPPLESFEIRR